VLAYFFLSAENTTYPMGVGGRVEKVKERKTLLAMKHSHVQVVWAI